MLRRVGLDAILEVSRGLEQRLADANDSEVRRAQVLLRSIHDRAHPLRHGQVLDTDALNTGERPGSLDLAVDQVVVLAIRPRPPHTGDDRDAGLFAAPACTLVVGHRAVAFPADGPEPGVLVVHGDYSMSAHRHGARVV